ncbi:hypothetical protein HDU87_003721 [Geranomyces variabilis]|uniref:RING-type domain-containing protein n=1 Tax=Geranomyces variabilis TaxID=109894 RepID=A0AAD5TLN8_9FUNG|nr:hypothetical protein HDU87_003721 [Geranomyces variabilis]
MVSSCGERRHMRRELAKIFATMIIHGDDLTRKSTVDRPADAKVFAFHRSFKGPVASSLAASCSGNYLQDHSLKFEHNAFDTILVMDAQIVPGMWDTDFTETKLRQIVSKRNDECIACQEVIPKERQVFCRKCYYPLCKPCIGKIGVGGPDGMVYNCPTCRAKMLVVCDME